MAEQNEATQIVGDDLISAASYRAQQKAALVWSIADTLRGLYKPIDYGKVILPMTVVKRFHDCLLPTHDAVMKKAEETKGFAKRDGFLTQESGYAFYNTSGHTWKTLIADADNIESNFNEYIHGFSDNVQDILFADGMKFEDEVKNLANNGVLYQVVKDFNSDKGDFGPEKVTETEMGAIFENLVSRFSEADEAGEHFTSRDIIYLMTDLVIAADPRVFEGDRIRKTVYDGSMGTSQMLSCMRERLMELDADADVTTFGQELNPFTFAIAKASAMIRNEDANNMRAGNTYDNDRFAGYQFDYVIQNPPFGISFAAQADEIKKEHAKGEDGRFPCELPGTGDGQTLFVLNGLAKLKDDGVMAIVQDASPMYKSNPGKGEDDYRRYIIENDWLDAIVQLPTDSFVNTGIATYIWLFDKNKDASHAGKVLLVDASNAFQKRRKGVGNKKNDITRACRDLIVEAYGAYRDGVWKGESDDGKEISVEAKLFDATEFGFWRVTVYTAARDDAGAFVLDSKGRKTIALGEDGKKLADTEDVPLPAGWVEPNPNNKEAVKKAEALKFATIDAYLEREVEPYNSGAFYEKKKVQVGYTVPFTRAFYKYKELESADVIAERILEHERALEESLKNLFGEVR